ncbi:TetR/AcrR family transcriptional regulator [Agrococcus baldri]|uniref:HTH tetR-type domain-containing protein n=1 Tax=Agrococcus baldri TaxID=153730 RepID=A0AA87US34_9MICO|nr:TetR family transcriptional regulator C-terminal domain-containing protein [Agrococcus baldri]GEK80488.1 hypothetical protein ABA31_18390 [Agrococcus baldri]
MGDAMRGVGSEHDAKRGAIVDAALRTTERGGVESLTFRAVATEAGVSLGRVQHYFANRTELLQAAYARVQQLAQERVTAELVASGGAGSGRAVVTAVLQALIPVTPTAHAHLRVTQMFDTAAMTDAAMLRQLRDGHAQLLDFLADQLAQAQSAGEVAARVDPARAALALLATAEGLSSIVLIGHTPAPIAKDALHQQLAAALDD